LPRLQCPCKEHCDASASSSASVPVAGAADVDALAAAMVAGEDTNFRLFGYVGAVNAEVDTLEAAAADLRAEVAAAADAAAAAETSRRAATQVIAQQCVFHGLHVSDTGLGLANYGEW